jgi:hypothetical protein
MPIAAEKLRSAIGVRRIDFTGMTPAIADNALAS